MITPKRLWFLVLILLAIYIVVYVILALNGIHDYSRHFSWGETLLMSMIIMISLGGILGALPALIPFGKRKISDRYFGFTFPICTALVIIVIGFFWSHNLYMKEVHGYQDPFNIDEIEEQYKQDSISRIRNNHTPNP